MARSAIVDPRVASLADLLSRLGHVSPERIRLHPAPGTAVETDVLARPGGEKRLCELVDGVLVDKPMGYYESLLAALLIGFLRKFLKQHDIGFVLGADATLRLAPGLVRLPDVSFVSWSRFPDRRLPAEPIPNMVPDLAVEVLSPGNTEPEMARKLREYFAVGCRLVWHVSPDERAVHVYTSPSAIRVVGTDDVLEGGEVLPGFQLPVGELFDRAGPRREG